MKRIIICISVFFLSVVLTSRAENRNDGYVTGGFETNTNLYHDDARTFATVPDGKFGSNNYLKLDYYNRKFSAGVQMEAYAPALVGYSSDLKGAALTNYYVNWDDDDFPLLPELSMNSSAAVSCSEPGRTGLLV